MFTGGLRASARIVPDYPSRAIRASAELKGLVVQSDNGAPIADAAVSLPLVNRHARTDSLGQFVFANIPATTQQIEIRKLGFEVLRDSVTAADLSTVRRYALVPSPQALDTVRTNATNPDFLSPSLKAFEQRRLSRQGGHFVSDSVLRANENSTLLNIVTSQIPGVSRVARSLVSTRKPCRGLAFRGCRHQDCFVSIYIDGVLRYRAQMAEGGVQPPDLTAFDVHTLAGLEFYADGASAPAGMHSDDDGCGTLWLWTREK